MPLLFCTPAFAAKIVVDKKTPKIISTDQIHQFAIDWDKIAKRSDAGKKSGENMVMQCDDRSLALIEVKVEGGFEGVTIESDCKLKGAQDNDESDSYLHFEGPDSNCEITIQKDREGKKPLKIVYELSASC